MCIGKGRGNDRKCFAARKGDLVSQNCCFISQEVLCVQRECPQAGEICYRGIASAPLSFAHMTHNLLWGQRQAIKIEGWNRVSRLLEVGVTKCCSLPGTCSSGHKSRLPLCYHSLCCALTLPCYCRSLHTFLCCTAAHCHGEQPCSPGNWMSRGKAMGKYTQGCVQVLAKPTHSLGQMGDRGGSGRARGGWCLYKVLDGAVLQNTALMVLWLVEMKTMAECPGANITGLACLLCICGLTAEHQTSFCHAGGDAATCLVPCAAQGSKVQRTRPSLPGFSCSWGGGRGENPKVSKDKWVLPQSTGGMGTLSMLPPVF